MSAGGDCFLSLRVLIEVLDRFGVVLGEGWMLVWGWELDCVGCFCVCVEGEVVRVGAC